MSQKNYLMYKQYRRKEDLNLFNFEFIIKNYLHTINEHPLIWYIHAYKYVYTSKYINKLRI